MKYDSYNYLFPQRPETKAAADLLPFYEARKFGAQVKKNGTCTVIFTNGTEVIFKTRHATENKNGDDHKQWSPLPSHLEFWKKAGGKDGTWNVFAVELVHSKTQDIKNQFYVFDLIVRDGIQLIGTTFPQRQTILHNMWKPIGDEIDQVRVNDYVGIAKTFYHGFPAIHKRILAQADIRAEKNLNVVDEGLVLKHSTMKMGGCFNETANRAWSVKVRIPHKNYSF